MYFMCVDAVQFEIKSSSYTFYLFGYLNHVIYVPSARGLGGCACTILFICECITFMCRFYIDGFTLLFSPTFSLSLSRVHARSLST